MAGFFLDAYKKGGFGYFVLGFFEVLFENTTILGPLTVT